MAGMDTAAHAKAAGAAICPGTRPCWRRIRTPSLLACLGLLTLLAGCAAPAGEPSARLGALGLLGTLNPFADDQARYTEQAAEIPFSSLIYDTGDRRGLVVMGVESGEHTLWPTDTRALLHLYGDGLYATGGLPQDLLQTRYLPTDNGASDATALRADALPWRQAEPGAFQVQRSWQIEDGDVLQMQARGTLRCDRAEPLDMPLARVDLEPCHLRLQWQDGRTTRGTLWRSPDQYRLWAVEEQLWPDGPRVRWQVARYWWSP